jgi:hypothetical protein
MKKTLALAACLLLASSATALAQDVCAPAKVASLAIATGHSTAVFSWTSPGDDCTTGTATSYDLRISTSPITEANFGSATQITTGTPQVAGSTECYETSSLSCNTTYYIALYTFDENGFRSPLSNLPSRITKPCNNYTEVTCL